MNVLVCPPSTSVEERQMKMAVETTAFLPKCSRDTAEMKPRHSRDEAEIQLRRSRDDATRALRCREAQRSNLTPQ